MTYNDLKLEIDINKYISKDKIKLGSVLVIGAAGTIGSNYVKEILKLKPSKLVCVDINENGLTELTRDLRSSNLIDYNPEFITYPVNLLSETFDKIFKKEKFSVVANFAAHKHVRSEKDLISIEALIKNNVYGAIKLLNLCLNKKPDYFFSVSTDKAANPVNIMGASKSLMEKLIISCKLKLRVSTARFANVAFSNGSLLDGYINRFKKKQPLSCPIDVKRFFVTPKQSGQICLLSTFLGKSGNIFFPKLDFDKDQIYFKDITLDYIKSKNLEPIIFDNETEAKLFDIEKNKKSYPVYFFKSDTSGEKKYEEFYTESENFNLKKYGSIGYIDSNENDVSFLDIINDFENIFNNRSSKKIDIIEVIKKYVPDFEHIETG